MTQTIYFKEDNVDERELLDKINKIIEKIDNLEAEVIKISQENDDNNKKMENLINNRKSRRKRK